MLSIRFCLRGGGGVGIESKYILRGSFHSKVLTSEDFCQSSTLLISIGGVELSEMSNIPDFIGLSSAWVGFCCAFVGAVETMAMTLKGVIGRFKSLRFGGMMACCRPYL